MLCRVHRSALCVLLALSAPAAASRDGISIVDPTSSVVENRDLTPEEGAGTYRDAIARYRSGQRARAIEAFLSMTDRYLLREANRFEHDRIAEMTPAEWREWAGRLRGAILLHTEVWLQSGSFRASAPVNVHDQIARTLARVLITRTADIRPDELHAAREFVRDWHLLVVSQLHVTLRIDVSRARLAEARRQFPVDAWLLLASGADHEALSVASVGWLRTAAGEQVSQGRINTTRELQRASELYLAALRVEPALEEARLRLGRVLHRLGDAEAARRELALVHATTAMPALKYLAAVFLALAELDAGQYDRAQELYAEAAGIFPTGHAVLLGMSELAYRTGRPADAADLVRELLGAVDEPDPWWHYILGTAWHADALYRSLTDRVRQ